jgi:tRNA pseudouridine38-40 synthase
LRNVRILVAYDGSSFCGWQRQDGFETVQEALEDALTAVVGESCTIHGSGRTDSGVHALGQVAHFHVDTALDDDRLWHALNANLPPGVAVRRVETCRDDFHAQFSARGKRYAYVVRTHRHPPAFGRAYAHWVRDPLDLAAMRAAAARFHGEHDFRALANSGSPRKTTVRRIAAIRVLARRERLTFVIQGSGFLYRMARVIAGTLLEVGRGKLGVEDVARILASKDRKLAGPTAPPEGLYMLSVLYDEPCFAGRPRGPRGVPGPFQY